MTLEIVLFILEFFLLSFLNLLPFLYDLNASFRYYFKFFVYYSLFVWVNLVVAPIATWTWAPICGSSPSIFYRLHRTIGCILNIRWKVIEEKNLNATQPCIIVANQQNLVDILGVYNVFSGSRRNVIIRLQRHHDYTGYFIRLISICNPILTFTKKEFRSAVYSTIMKEIKNKKANVWIFCEDVAELDTKVLNMALQDRIPVIPLVLSDYYFINSRENIFDPGVIYMKILPHLSQNENTLPDKESDPIKDMQSIMKNEFATLSAKITPPTLEALWLSYKL